MGQLDMFEWKRWSWRYWLRYPFHANASTSLISQKESQVKVH